jgi:hypothetical protein
MFVLTVDQIDSRHQPDLVADELERLNTLGARLVRPPDRTAGDELQFATDDADTALDQLLRLTRSGRWSVGVGVGGVREPRPASTREMSGTAFENAREAVDAAKKRATRLAIRIDAGRSPDTELVEPLVDLLVQLRDRRTAEGWELHDLLESGLTQTAAAERLGITPQAASRRARAAQLRLDGAARLALARLLAAADRNEGGSAS